MRLELLNQVITASGDGASADPRFIGLVFFLSGFIFCWAMYRRYRNTDKRHMHESETEAKMLDVRAADQHVDTLRGLKNSKMQGANNHEVRGTNGGASAFPGFDVQNITGGRLPGGRGL